MGEQFFEGADFQGGDFKALIPKHYPPEYQRYIEEETQLLVTKLTGANRVLEGGVGIGRLIPDVAPVVQEFVGVDVADLMLRKSQERAADYPSVKIMRLRLEDLHTVFPENSFDKSICVWNTLGNVSDEAKVLRELAHVTVGSIFTTVYKKGTLQQRKNWYSTVGVPLHHIDDENEIFYTESGLVSRSYSEDDLERIAKSAGLHVADSRVLNRVMLWTELSKKGR